MENKTNSAPLLVALLLFTVIGCGQSDSNSAGTANRNDPIPVGELMEGQIEFEFAVYYLPTPKKDPQLALAKLLETKYKMFTSVNELTGAETELSVAPRLMTDVQETYAPPDASFLSYFGRGLTREQTELLQDCETAIVLKFGYSKQHIWKGLRAAYELSSDLARETDGLLWDEETREVFSPDAWTENRLAKWTEEIPDISNHTVIHSYKSGEYVRAITLGMKKFGLPDIVVDGFSWSLGNNMGAIINLLGQTLAEGNTLEKKGQFDIDLNAIENPQVRESQLESLKENAKAVALLSLNQGTWEEGDPNNRLIEINFDRYPGNDVHARQEAMLSGLFGSEDSIELVKHDDELVAASRAAKAKLPGLRADFSAGLDPGEFIQLKAPFTTANGEQEWMWVEVTSWNGSNIKGLLRNEPFNVPELHAGQIVNISEKDVFDYIRRRPDGTQEGNETGKLIAKQNQQ